MISNLLLHPGLILILGALVVPFLSGITRKLFVIALPAIGFLCLTTLSSDMGITIPFAGYELEIFRIDKLSKAFAYIFTISSFTAFIYGWYQEKAIEPMSALMYVGAAIGVVFAGDLLTLYIFWEVMAVTSTFLILARRTAASLAAAKRYILVHVFGGLLLLAGIILFAGETGSLAFTRFDVVSLSSWLILFGFLVNAAAVPFSSWLPDAYPESTVFGGVVLSAYTSKTAVYTLIRGFPGWDILIVLGCIMTIYGIIYALLENDMRRILAYSIVSQVGFMVCAVGVGTPLALSGAVAHAFCHILYKSLLWMCAGAVLYRVGKSKCTELGGLYKSMPWTLGLGTIGALAVSAPLTSGFTSKTMIIAAVESQHMFWTWFTLELAAAAVFWLAGIKFLYFVFFNKDQQLKPKEAPKSMLLAMSVLAFLCIIIGLAPEKLYNILPHTDVVKSVMPYTFSDIYVHHFGHVVTQSQLLLFSGLAFFLMLPLLKRTHTISLDFDWFYRKGSALVYNGLDKSLNLVNVKVDTLVRLNLISKLSALSKRVPLTLALAGMNVVWMLQGVTKSKLATKQCQFEATFENNVFPVGLSAGVVLAVFVLLSLI